MRILITGAGGFVGRHLLEHLTALRGPEVEGVWGPGSDSGPACDLADPDATRALIADLKPDVIVHLAAMSSVGVGAAQPEAVWRNNFDATRSVAAAARALSRDVRLVFASSGEIYGRRFNEGPCDEDAPIAPMSVYARSKAASELQLQDAVGDGLSVTALRLFNHTGPGQDTRFVAPAFAAQIAAAARAGGGEIRVGNLEARRDFSDVRDVVRAYAAVILDSAPPERGFEVLNVGSGRTTRIGDLLDILIRLSGVSVEVVSDPDRMRPSDIPDASGRFDRILSRTGWRADIPLEETLASVYRAILDPTPAPAGAGVAGST